jgi:hypothetical protein
MRCHHLLVPLVLIVTVSSCRQATQEPPPSPAPVVYDEHTVTVTEGPCTAIDEPCARVTIRYLEAIDGGTEAVRDAVNMYTSHLVVSWLRDRVAEADRVATDAETLAEAYTARYREFITEFPDSAQRWVVEITQSSPFNSSRFSTVDYRLLDDSGGAHPNSFRRLVSFDVATGDPIDLADLVTDLDQLAARAEAAFRKARGIGASDDLSAAGFTFPAGKFELTENVAITGEGLTLYWNPYDIAPYALGPTEAVLAPDAIRDLMRGDPWLDVAGP